jgi:hypothetical protein
MNRNTPKREHQASSRLISRSTIIKHAWQLLFKNYMRNIIGIDQYGQVYHALGQHPRQELLGRLGYSHARKMYVDKKDGSTLHIGYVIGSLWITLYGIERIELVREGGEKNEQTTKERI